ncbi:Xyloglucan endo-transglycosylase, partial [Theobroma cacao]
MESRSPINLFTDVLVSQELDATSQENLQMVQNNYMIYNYCSDNKRFPQRLAFPLQRSLEEFNANACVWSNGASSCKSNSPSSSSTNNAWLSQELDSTSQQ